MNIEQFRATYPQYNDLSDSQLVDALHSKFYSDLDRSEVQSALGVHDYNAGDFVKDSVIKLGQGAIDLGQQVVGGADLVTGGVLGIRDNLEKYGGYKPEQAKQILSNELSDTQQRQDAAFSQAHGLDKFGAAVENPLAVTGAIEQSIPSMLAGMGLTKAVATKIFTEAAIAAGGLETAEGIAAGQAAVQQAAGKLIAVSSGAEGALSAGGIAEEADRNGKNWSEYAPEAIGAGAVTGAIGFGSGKLFGDVATDLAAGTKTMNGGFLSKIGKGALTEGLMEEAPQSASETAFTNSIYDRPIGEGVADSAIEGGIIGGVMGAAMGGGEHFTQHNQPENTSPLGEQILKDEAPIDSAPNYQTTNPSDDGISNNLGDLSARVDAILNPTSQQNPIQQIAKTETIDEAIGAFNDSVIMPPFPSPVSQESPQLPPPVIQDETAFEQPQTEIKYPTKLDDSQESIALIDQFLSSGAMLTGRFLIHDNNQVTALTKTQKDLAEELLKNESDINNTVLPITEPTLNSNISDNAPVGETQTETPLQSERLGEITPTQDSGAGATFENPQQATVETAPILLRELGNEATNQIEPVAQTVVESGNQDAELQKAQNTLKPLLDARLKTIREGIASGRKSVNKEIDEYNQMAQYINLPTVSRSDLTGFTEVKSYGELPEAAHEDLPLAEDGEKRLINLPKIKGKPAKTVAIEDDYVLAMDNGKFVNLPKLTKQQALEASKTKEIDGEKVNEFFDVIPRAYAKHLGYKPVEDKTGLLDNQKTIDTKTISYDNIDGLIKRPSDNAPFKDAKSANTRIKLTKLDPEEYSVVPVEGGFAIAPIKSMDYPQFKALSENAGHSDNVLMQTYEALTGKVAPDISKVETTENPVIENYSATGKEVLPVDQQNNEMDLVDNSTPTTVSEKSTEDSKENLAPNLPKDLSKINDISLPENWKTDLPQAKWLAGRILRELEGKTGTERQRAVESITDIEKITPFIRQVLDDAESQKPVKVDSPYHPAIANYANQLVKNGGVEILPDGRRTPSVNPDWFKTEKGKGVEKTFKAYKTVDKTGKILEFYSKSVSVDEVHKAVAAHENNQKLTARQHGILLALSDVAQAEENFHNRNDVEFDDDEISALASLSHEIEAGETSIFGSMSEEAFDKMLDDLTKKTLDQRESMLALGFTEQEIKEALQNDDDTQRNRDTQSNVAREEEGGNQNANGAEAQSTDEPSPLRQYTREEILAHEEELAALENQEKERELKAKQKLEADLQIDTLADEMLGKGGTATRSLFDVVDEPKRKSAFDDGSSITDKRREVSTSVKQTSNEIEQPKLKSDDLAKHLANAARGNGIGYSKNKDGAFNLTVDGNHVATVDYEPSSAKQVTEQILKNYKFALYSEGKTLPSNPEDMTRDQFLIANKFGKLIQDFEISGADLQNETGGLKHNADGTFGIDHDALYDRIQAQKDEKPAIAKQSETVSPEKAALQKILKEQARELAEALLTNHALKAIHEEKIKIVPLMSNIMETAFKLGYLTFKENARFVLNSINEISKEAGALITIHNLRAGYINFSQSGEVEGTSSFSEVGEIKTIDEILNSDNTSIENENLGEINVPSANTDLERHSTDTDAIDPRDATPIFDESTTDARIFGQPSKPAKSTENVANSDKLDSIGIALTGGKQGDNELSVGNETTGITPSDARDSDSGRSGGDSIERMDVRRDGSNPIKELPAKSVKGLTPKQVAHVEADLENVKEAMPFLNEGQASDVVFAEKRLAEHKGVMFTNGTGTGKTFTGLGIVSRYVNQGKNNILIVAPSQNILDSWTKAAKNFFGIQVNLLEDKGDAGKGVVATTYANFGDNVALVNRDWDLIVTDEAHYLMSNAAGNNTDSLKQLRGLTGHEDGFFAWFNAKNHELVAELTKLNQLNRSPDKTGYDEERHDELSKEHSKLLEAARAEWEEKEHKTKVVMLSATPFAYESNIDYANGYLFNYDKADGSGYNSGGGKERFFMQHLGYRMRYNKLTQPDAKVDRSTMQRQFNEMLKSSGALSARTLDVPFDYDRRFILTESAVGQRIDEALQWLSDNEARELSEKINKTFDYLTRRYLLEAIKAKEIIPIVKEHIAAGRKVLVFHDYKKGGTTNPFNVKSSDEAVVSQFQEFKRAFPDLTSGSALQGIYLSPIEHFEQEFGKDVLIYNGDVSSKDRIARVAQFNDDNSGKNLILLQSASAKEGVSFHDTTGVHQRVLINIGLPTAPTTAIQQEGRIYRVGQKSDAIFRYVNTGTNWERWAFASTIAGRASAAENLALGEGARGLRDAFINAFENSDSYPAGHEGEGKGGKEADRQAYKQITEMDRAKGFYYATQKKNARTKSAEGTDYFATPEPVGLAMTRLADARAGEKMLEPSAGHGAIARWFRTDADRTAIEPSSELNSRLALVFQDGDIKRQTFEDLNIVNKYDAIVMNPPFGVGGKTAIEHLEKAFNHLRDGGRVVALIPEGTIADNRLDAFLNSNEPVEPLIKDTPKGDIYAGDIIKTTGFIGQGRSRKIGEISFKAAKVINVAGKPSMITNDAGDKIVSLGMDKFEVDKKAGATSNKQLVADISLPTITFERAGTKVKTHIIVIEKTTESIYTKHVNYDHIDDINELFDKIDDLSIPHRIKPIEEIAEIPVAQNESASSNDSNDVINYITKAGKTLRGKLRSDLSKEQAKEIDPYTWMYTDKETGSKGWFIREAHWNKLPDDNKNSNVENFHSIHAEKNTPQRIHVSSQIKKLLTDFEKGNITQEQLTRELSKLHGKLEAKKDDKALHEAQTERVRGADYIRQKLLEAKRRGDLSEDAADLAEWFILQNEALMDDLGISIKGKSQSENKGSAGYYSPLYRILTLIKGSAKDSTAVHEMLHHLERLMPQDLQAGIRNEWLKQTLAQYKKATGLHADYFEAALSGNQQRALQLLNKIGDKNQKLYRFINASEFWAVNSTDILQNRFHAKSSAIGRLKQWLREFVQYVRKTFGFASHSPLLDALDYLLNQSNGEKQSNRLLSQNNGHFFADRNDDNGLPNPNKQDIFDRTEQKIRNSKTGKFLNKFPRWFTAMGTLADRDDYLIERYKTLGRIDSVDRLVHEIFSTLRKASKEDAAAIYDFLTLKDALPNEIHDPNLRMAAKNVKDVIVTIGEKMVERGLITQEVYEANKGAYLPRLYLKHILGNELYESIGTGKNLSDLGYLKKRKDIPEEVRRLWLMEIKNPAYLASRSISVTMRDLAIMNFFDQIANNEKWVWKQSLITIEVDDENKPTAIFDKDGNIDYKKTQKVGDKLGKSIRRVTPYFLAKEAERMRRQSVAAPTEDKAEIRALADALEQTANNAIDEMAQEGTPKDFVQMPDSARYGALRGLVIRKEIYDDIVGVFSMTQGEKGWAENWLGDMGVLAQLSGFFKTTHVVLNPPTQIVNFISNLSMIHLSGVAFHKVPVRMVQALREVINNGKHYQALVDMGGNKATFSNQELRRMNEYLLESEAEKSGEWTWHDIQLLAAKVLYQGNKVVTAAGNVHQFMEMWSKTAVVIDKMEKGMAAEKAVLAAHDALIDYSLVSRNVRYLRNVPLGAPFITFFVKSSEILLDMMINRPWKFIPYYLTLYAMQLLVASMADTDKDDVDKLSELLPKWMRDKGHAYILPFKDSRGDWQGMDFSKFLPWGTQAAMVNLAARGEVAQAIEQIGLLGTPIAKIISAYSTNTDSFTERPIVDKYGTPIEQIGDMLRYAYNTFTPPFLKLNDKNQIDLISETIGELNKYGELKKTKGQALAYLFGANARSVTPLSREKELARFDYEIADIKRNWSHEKNDRNLSQDDRDEIDELYKARIERVKNAKTKYMLKSDVSSKLMAR